MKVYHPEMAAGRWQTFSLAEQLGNVGSEISRAINWKEKNKKFYQDSMERAFELLDLTTQDPRWRGPRLRELLRVRELLADAFFEGEEYGTTLEDLNRYFLFFAFTARRNR